MSLLTSGVLARPAGRTWQSDKSKGAMTLPISAGHAIDIVCYCLGEFAEVAAKVAAQAPEWRVIDTGGSVKVDAPDTVLVSGVLENGAVASVHVAAVPHNGSAWRMEVYGRDGAIVATSNQMAQMAEVRIMASKGAEPLADLNVPDRYTVVPEGMPKGPPINVGQMYARFADAVAAGKASEPDFELALRHKLIEAIQPASDQGRTVKVSV